MLILPGRKKKESRLVQSRDSCFELSVGVNTPAESLRSNVILPPGSRDKQDANWASAGGVGFASHPPADGVFRVLLENAMYPDDFSSSESVIFRMTITIGGKKIRRFGGCLWMLDLRCSKRGRR